MNLKYCELNRFYSIDCRICDIFIFFIYFYIYRKKKKIFFGRGVLGVWWVIYGFFGVFFCNVGDRGRVGMLLFKKKDIICILILFFL